MKRLTILLAVILALSIFASAAETTTAEVPVTLTVIESQRQISVTVPAALPVSVVDGKVLTASNAAIRNHGKDPVAVTAISVKPGAYDIGSFDRSVPQWLRHHRCGIAAHDRHRLSGH